MRTRAIQATMISILMLASALLLGCGGDRGSTEPKTEAAQIANPASTYCVSKGGKVEIRKDKDGNETGICHLPDGTQVEEWELFRRDHPQSDK